MEQAQTKPLDSKTCPLCGGPNGCCVKSGIGACWCSSTAFTPGVLARVPPELQRKVCICQACATANPAQTAQATSS